MGDQPNLFGTPEPPPKPTAPFVPGSNTSAEAARAIAPETGTLREQVYAYIAAHPGCCDEEIADGLMMNPSTERPRRIELLADQRIRQEGTTKTAAGRKAVAWVTADTDAKAPEPFPRQPGDPEEWGTERHDLLAVHQGRRAGLSLPAAARLAGITNAEATAAELEHDGLLKATGEEHGGARVLRLTPAGIAALRDATGTPPPTRYDYEGQQSREAQ